MRPSASSGAVAARIRVLRRTWWLLWRGLGHLSVQWSIHSDCDLHVLLQDWKDRIRRPGTWNFGRARPGEVKRSGQSRRERLANRDYVTALFRQIPALDGLCSSCREPLSALARSHAASGSSKAGDQGFWKGPHDSLGKGLRIQSCPAIHLH